MLVVSQLANLQLFQSNKKRSGLYLKHLFDGQTTGKSNNIQLPLIKIKLASHIVDLQKIRRPEYVKLKHKVLRTNVGQQLQILLKFFHLSVYVRRNVQVENGTCLLNIHIPMSKVAIPPSKSWNCATCTFENDPMMLVCELCSQPKEKDLLEEPPIIGRGGSSDDKIVCDKCTFINTLDSVKCQTCGVSLFGDEPPAIQKIVYDLVVCIGCGFENSKDNMNCLNCQKLLKEPAPGSPIKEIKLKQCPICTCVLAQSLYDRHFKECQESAKLLQQIDRENKEVLEREKESMTQECPYCFDRIQRSISQKHIIQCSKKGDFFKQQRVFGRLTPVQKQTIKFMHTNSEKQHFSSKRILEDRFKKLGLKKHDLEALHHYIQNYAPIIVHIHITKHMEFFIKDTHYRNQFETGKSSGSLSRPSRITWQGRMFNKKYDKAKDSERVKYGTINFTNDPKGVNSCRGYGNSYLLLKSDVRERCTFTDQDSSSASSLIGTFKFCFHVLNRLTDAELKAAVQAAKAMEVSSSVIGTYKEIQIHGPIEFAKDIQRLYVNKIEVQDKKFMTMVEEFSKKFNVDYEIFT